MTDSRGVHLSFGKTFFIGFATSLTLVLAESFAVLGITGVVEWRPGSLKRGECLN